MQENPSGRWVGEDPLAPAPSPPPEPRVFFPDGRSEEDQPRWRRDFPIDWPRDHHVSRREFTKFLVLTSLAFTVGQFGIGLASLGARRTQPEPKALARVDELPVGGSLQFQYPGEKDPNLLVHLSPGVFVAYGQRCPHLQCAVLPRPDLGRFQCPCHEGWFDMADGHPLAGPPRRPLPRVLLEVRGGVVYATGVEERPV